MPKPKPKPAQGPTFHQFLTGLCRVPLTPGQGVIVKVAFDGVEPKDLPEAERGLAQKIFGPLDTIPPEARAVFVAVCGARAGKTYILGALYSLWRALVADLSTLAPGEVAVALIVAPDLRLARQAIRYAVGAAELIPAVKRCIESKSTDQLTIRRPDGHVVTIEALPATRGGSALRGRSLVSAVLDECAFFRDESAVVNDVDLFRAVAPRVLPGGLVVIASTPWTEAGLLYDEFTKNWGSPRTALAAHAPTLFLLNTKRNQEAVARERERDPDNAAREFDAEFMTGGAGLFFGPTLVAPALIQGLPPCLKPPRGAIVGVGGDFGLVRDSSAYAAIHRTARTNAPDLYRLGELLERRPTKGSPLKLSEVVKLGCEFAARHERKVIGVDHYALEPAREHLEKDFVLDPVEEGNAPKTERYLKARELFRQSQIQIPGEYVRLVVQLGDVVGKPLPGGGYSITMPRRHGAHGDLVAAFVNAIWLASQGDLVDWGALHLANARVKPVTRWGSSRGRGYG